MNKSISPAILAAALKKKGILDDADIEAAKS